MQRFRMDGSIQYSHTFFMAVIVQRLTSSLPLGQICCFPRLRFVAFRTANNVFRFDDLV